MALSLLACWEGAQASRMLSSLAHAQQLLCPGCSPALHGLLWGQARGPSEPSSPPASGTTQTFKLRFP